MCIQTWFTDCNHFILFCCGFKRYSSKCFTKNIIEDTYCSECFKKFKAVITETPRNMDPYSVKVLNKSSVLDGLI